MTLATPLPPLASPAFSFIHPARDPWHRASGEDGPRPQPVPVDHALLTLEQWHAVRAHWPANLAVGVMVPNDVAISTLQGDLARLKLVALTFPKWTDGRAYSQARVLRGRLGFAGELRALGDVLVDMVPLLLRTGFDSAQLRGDQREQAATTALSLVRQHYQADVHQTLPVYARGGA